MAKRTTHNQRRKFERVMELGTLSLEFGDPQTALDYFQCAKGIDPHSFEARFGIAKSLHYLRLFEESIDYLYTALDFTNDEDDVAQVCFYIGQNLLCMKKYEEAEENLDEALYLAPDLACAYISKAYIYCSKKSYTQAYLSAEIAVRLQPEIAEAHHVFGLACKELEYYEKAITAFKTATTISSEFGAPYFLMGEIYYKQRRWGLAEEAYTEWLALYPELPEAKEKMTMAISKLAELQ